MTETLGTAGIGLFGTLEYAVQFPAKWQTLLDKETLEKLKSGLREAEREHVGTSSRIKNIFAGGISLFDAEETERG